jgi:DNA polymerase I-like protein with 3'-5' exonuclease and polymerase domains
MPRGTTFPVRECVVSRWEGGKILEGDYSQLEFRVAGFLANDDQVYADVQKGFDVHSFSAEALGVSRQEAKAHTFKPLYGGTYGTEKEVEYYDLFKARYSAVARWHVSLQNEAIKTKKITLPSGRIYHFPHVRRNFHGGSTHATAIKNYPVQGFATADLLPLALINLRKILFDKGMQSVVCNTVHDSIVLDVFPEEEKEVIEILAESMLSIRSEAKKRYNIDYDMPIGIELKIGKDWLNMEEVLTL